MINTSAQGVYLTTLRAPEIQALQQRLNAFDYDAPLTTQYAEIESIMNTLNHTLGAESDQMDLGSLYAVMEKVREGRPRVSKPYEFINVLQKIVGHLVPTERQMGGWVNPVMPRVFQIPGARPPVATTRPPVATTRPPVATARPLPKELHRTMTPAEAANRQRAFRQTVRNKPRALKRTNTANANVNYGQVYPVTNSFNIPVGNANNSRVTRASSAANMYNLFERPRHKAAWNTVFENSRRRSMRTRRRRAGSRKHRSA